MKIQFDGRSRIPQEERLPGLFYFEMREADDGFVNAGYTIERHVLVNNIGCLISDVNILEGKSYITDDELEEMGYEEVNYFT